MGMYDTFGESYEQLKVGECLLRHYAVGERVNLPNGIYCGYDRAIVINGGLFVADMPLTRMYNKWGGQVVIDVSVSNPIGQAIKEMREKKDEDITDGHDEGTG